MSKGSRDRTKDHAAYRDGWSKVFGEKREHADRPQYEHAPVYANCSVDASGYYVPDLYHGAEQAAEAERLVRLLDDVMKHGDKDQGEPTGLVAYGFPDGKTL